MLQRKEYFQNKLKTQLPKRPRPNSFENMNVETIPPFQVIRSDQDDEEVDSPRKMMKINEYTSIARFSGALSK